MRVLVVNAGSTSLKLSMVGRGDDLLAAAEVEMTGRHVTAGIDRFLTQHGPVDVIGHRIVHGGPSFSGPVRIDDAVRDRLGDLNDLAPLHNPPALEAVDALRRLQPAVPAVACFDTTFHAGMPAPAATYALPAEWVQRWGLRRYGFHGLSCEWATGRAASLLGRPAGSLRLAICHLGGGASVTAVVAGRSVDTTMGFTPAAGLVMATRCGDVDPGLVAWLAVQGVGAGELAEALERRSGLAALCGTGDMRELLGQRRGVGPGSAAAGAAVTVYLHRLRAGIAAMAAAAGGLDALVFTGGVGEHSPEIRAEACAGLAWMQVAIEPSANAAAEGDADLTAPGARVRTLVVTAREDLVVAAACRRLLSE